MEQLKQFLCDIHIKDTYIQYGELHSVDCVSGDKSVFDYLENNKHKDLYSDIFKTNRKFIQPLDL